MAEAGPSQCFLTIDIEETTMAIVTGIMARISTAKVRHQVAGRLLATLAVAAAIMFASTGGASAAPAGAATDSRDLAAVALQPPRVMRIFHDWGARYLDAHEISFMDYNVVTRPLQGDSTQLWLLTDMGFGQYTIVQVSSGRFLDAHEIASLDYRVVTRPQQNNSTQLWRLQPLGGDYHTIQHVSSGRYLDSYHSSAQDFQAVTRPANATGSQQWRILCPNRTPTC
jgi:Ricin-type beta-trefoil lectin domain-like